LRRVPAAGGDPVPLGLANAQTEGQSGQLWPEFLPGDRGILFTTGLRAVGENSTIAVHDLKTGADRVLIRGGSHPRYVATGHLVYAVAGTLRVVGFDLARLAVTGDPRPVLEGVLMKPVGAADYGVSRTGTLVYISGVNASIGARLVWVDRQGHEEVMPAVVLQNVAVGAGA